MGCKHGKVNWLKCIIFLNHYTIFFNLRLEFDLPIGCQDATNLPNWVFDLHPSIQFLYIAILLCNSRNVLLELIDLLWHSHVFFIKLPPVMHIFIVMSTFAWVWFLFSSAPSMVSSPFLTWSHDLFTSPLGFQFVLQHYGFCFHLYYS
jgi:hypothetical protein